MLNWWHVLVGLLLPACGVQGAAGLPVPAPMEMTAITRPSTPNTALAAPAGFHLTADIVTRRYSASPERIFAALIRVAAAQERVFEHATYPAARQAHWVARTRLMNYPDLVTGQVNADGTVILWSRSVYGYSDLGANRARLEIWLAALDREVAAEPGG